MPQPMQLMIDGQPRAVDVPEDVPLLWVLRDLLGLTGTKFGCDSACTVHLDGEPVRSCMLPVGAVGSRAVTSIEDEIARSPTQLRIRAARHEGIGSHRT